MPNLSIKNVPEQVVAKLRQRAVSHHRSLQGELLDLICRATDDDIDEIKNTESQSTSSGWLSIEEVAFELQLSQTKTGKEVPLAVDLIRQDRDAR